MPLFTSRSRLSRRSDRDYAMAADVVADVRAAWLERFPRETPTDFRFELRAPVRNQCVYSFHEEDASAPLRFRAGRRQIYVTIEEGPTPISDTYLEGTAPPSEAQHAVQLCKRLFFSLHPGDTRRLVIARLFLATAEPVLHGQYEAKLVSSLDGGPFRFEVLREGEAFAAIDFAFLAPAMKLVRLSDFPPTQQLLKSVGIDSDRVASRFAGLLCRAARDALDGWDRAAVDPVSVGLYCPFAGVLQDPVLLDLLQDESEPLETRYRMRIPPLRHLRRASYVQAAWVSMQNNLQGPTHTFVHEREGLAQALDQAWADLDTGLVKHALVVAALGNVDDEPGPERALAALIHGAPSLHSRRELERELLAFFHGGGRIEP